MNPCFNLLACCLSTRAEDSSRVCSYCPQWTHGDEGHSVSGDWRGGGVDPEETEDGAQSHVPQRVP
jgi:hypothetical protein